MRRENCRDRHLNPITIRYSALGAAADCALHNPKVYTLYITARVIPYTLYTIPRASMGGRGAAQRVTAPALVRGGDRAHRDAPAERVEAEGAV